MLASLKFIIASIEIFLSLLKNEVHEVSFILHKFDNKLI
jgi:hypothetical protein